MVHGGFAAGRQERPLTFGASAQQRVMEAIRRHFRDFGGSPSYRELERASGIPRRVMGRVVRELDLKGIMRAAPGVARGIVLADRAAMLSDAELELAVIARGGRIAWPADVAAPLAIAFPVLPEPDCGIELEQLLAQVDRADEERLHGAKTASIESTDAGADRGEAPSPDHRDGGDRRAA